MRNVHSAKSDSNTSDILRPPDQSSLQFEKVKLGNRDPGSVTRFVRKLQTETTVREVPCNGCTGCCRSPNLIIDLLPHEVPDWSDVAVYNPDTESMALPKRDDGSCIFLVDGKCSVYDRRPFACRMYDCRCWLLFRMVPDDPVLHDAVLGWKAFGMPTAADRDTYMAANLAITDGGLDVYSGFEPIVRKFITALRSPLRWARYMAMAAEMRKAIDAMPRDRFTAMMRAKFAQLTG